MNKALLAAAIRAHAQALTDKANDRPEGWLEAERDTIELVNIAARWVEGVPIAKAFGPPGDWGYSHPIGKAIYARETEEQTQAPSPARCNSLLRHDGKPYPRTCAECGLGPCKLKANNTPLLPMPEIRCYPDDTRVVTVTLATGEERQARYCEVQNMNVWRYVTGELITGVRVIAWRDLNDPSPPKCDHDWKPTGNGTEEKCSKCAAICPF